MQNKLSVDQCLAPTPDLESHRRHLREAFGNTMSDEFVDVLLGKLAEALRPGPFDALEEPTMNAALAIIDSMQPQSEPEASLACKSSPQAFPGYDCCDKEVGVVWLSSSAS
jgi:hypothetical protein